MLKSTAASDALHEARQKLEKAERGEVTPRAPSAIPLREYYEESDRQQQQLIELQQEQLERLQRAGLVQKTQPPSAHRELGHDGSLLSGTHRASRLSATTRSLSIFGMFKSGQKAAGASRKVSDLTSTSLVRRQSAVGFGMLSASDAPNTPVAGAQRPRPSDVSSSFETTTSVAFQLDSSMDHHAAMMQRSGSIAGTISPPQAPLSANTASGGGRDKVVGTEALASLLKKDHRGHPLLLKPLYNPYRNFAAEEAGRNNRLRPRTVQILQPLSMEEASQAREPFRMLRSEAEQLRERQQRKAEDELRAWKEYADGPHQLVKQSLESWRMLEEDQLAIHRRDELLAARSTREQWQLQNRNTRGILEKVAQVQHRAADVQAARLDERLRLKRLEASSTEHVDRECMAVAEGAFRAQLVAAEQYIRAHLSENFHDGL